MPRRLTALAAACLLTLAGCGGSAHHTTRPAAPAATRSVCPQAAAGHGAMGVCGPRAKLGLLAPHPSAGLTVYPDLSNNDPCYCGATLKAQGYRGLIVKANQGVGFIDWTAAPMVASARAAGLPVGAYDFDQDYTLAEAKLFAARLRALGMLPGTHNTFPVTFDVEYGAFSRAGLQAQINYMRSLGYRVLVYTGDWYWGPHAGCWQPAGLTGEWLSGYPLAIVPCGFTVFNVHQFTSTPFDKDAYFGPSFAAFVNAGPAHLICFGAHAQVKNATCVKVRKQVASWRNAAKASANASAGTQRAIGRLETRKAMFDQRERYFNATAAKVIKAYS